MKKNVFNLYIEKWNGNKTEYELYIRFFTFDIRLSDSQRALWFRGRSLINTSNVNHVGFWAGLLNKENFPKPLTPQ